MQAVKKSALSCTARAVLHSTFLPKLERDSGEHSRYLCSSHFWIPYPLWFAYPKDQVCVLTVRLFYWSSYCSKTLLLIHCGVIFLSQCIYFNTSSQSQRQGMSSATIVWRCVIPAWNTDPVAGFSLPAPAGVTLAAAMQQMPLSHLFICVREASEAPASVPAVNGLQIFFSEFASSQSGLVFLLPVLLGINIHWHFPPTPPGYF